MPETENHTSSKNGDNKPENTETERQESKKAMTNRKIPAFSIEFGFMIIIPLLIFALGGKWLSGRYDNMLFLYGGIILALLVSIAWFYKRINDIYNDFIN